MNSLGIVQGKESEKPSIEKSKYYVLCRSLDLKEFDRLREEGYKMMLVNDGVKVCFFFEKERVR